MDDINKTVKIEYRFPDVYPQPPREDYATDEEWRKACQKNSTKDEWKQYINLLGGWIAQRDIESLLGVCDNTVAKKIRPCVPHISLKDGTGDCRYGAAYYLYDKKKLQSFLMKPENLKRSSIYIDMYAYPELISEATISKVNEFLKLKKEKQTYPQELLNYLRYYFEPFYLANKQLKQGTKIYQQCPVIVCSLEKDIELEELIKLDSNKEKLKEQYETANKEQIAFEQGWIHVALFGYVSDGKGGFRSTSKRFISSNHQETPQSLQRKQQWVLVGYEAWQKFLKNIEIDSQNVVSDEKEPLLEDEPEQKITIEENAEFIKIADDVLSKRAKHLFITGAAGTGKTVCICNLVKQLQEKGKKLLLCATTGIAADHLDIALHDGSQDTNTDRGLDDIHCQTVHSAFNINPDNSIDYYSLESKNIERLQGLIEAEIIIIDEISMLRMDVFSKVMTKIKQAEEYCEKNNLAEELRSKQVVLVGDFFQLPPVITEEDRNKLLMNNWPKDWIDEGGYCFFSPLWDFKMQELTQNYRQQADTEWLEHLKNIRVADKNGIKDTLKWLNKNRRAKNEADFRDAISIVTTREFADDFNRSRLNCGVVTYNVKYRVKEATDEIDDKLKENNLSLQSEKLKNIKIESQLKKLNISNVLELKIGARVIATKNDKKKGFVNGSIGVVEKLDIDKDSIYVRFNRKKDIVEVKRAKYPLKKNPYVIADDEENVIDGQDIIGYVYQFPLQLAYAITIHKSQGLTLNKAKISPDGAWENGQLYTALSRLKSEQGLCLMGDVLESHIKTSDKVKAFYNGKDLGISAAPPRDKNQKLWNQVRIELEKLKNEYDKVEKKLVKEKNEEKKLELQEKWFDSAKNIFDKFLSKSDEKNE